MHMCSTNAKTPDGSVRMMLSPGEVKFLPQRLNVDQLSLNLGCNLLALDMNLVDYNQHFLKSWNRIENRVHYM